MIQFEELRLRLLESEKPLEELAAALGLEEMSQEVASLEAKTTDENFWGDLANSQKVLQRIAMLKNKIKAYTELKTAFDDALVMIELSDEEGDLDLLDECRQSVEAVEQELEKQTLATLLSGEYDGKNAILTFHAGAGGTEAQDWCQMLFRMYGQWATKHGYKFTTVDFLDGDEAGLKSAVAVIEGENAYGYLKGENGVHRLVRVSPFDASGRRHTSFASVEVMPEFTDDGSIEINEADLEITTHKSSGAGGQHINKTESAVRIVHIPTGIVVGCQTERSQLQNKETAMKMLKSKLMEIKQREKLDTINDIKGVKTNIEWGSQIRSYVFMPYTLAKDTRTQYEDGNIQAVMDGEIDGFINAYLKMNAAKNDG